MNDVKKKNKKKSNETVKKVILFLFIVFTVVILSIIGYFVYEHYFFKGLEITKIKEGSKVSDDNTKTVNVYVNGNADTKCSIDGKHWKDISFGKCSFALEAGEYTFIVKNKNKELKKDFKLYFESEKSLSFNIEDLYIAKDERYEPILNNTSNNNDLNWVSDNESVATVNDGIIKGVNYGEANITVSGKKGAKASLKVIVTNLITKPEFNLKKQVVKCKQYTKEEAAILDKALFQRVQDKGEGTRAALIEVIRFITLSFKEKIPYFYENGRLGGNGIGRKADGEGRYYHKGFYLSEDKFDNIEKLKDNKGPAIWGCPLTNLQSHPPKYVPGGKVANGLDCSGFVTWSLFNGGVDVGDIGAGIDPNVKDMSDIGENNKLTYDFLNSDNYKVGDVIARWGHTALIAGKDDQYIYIAESLLRGVRMEKYDYKSKSSVLYTTGWYTYVNTLDDYYKGDSKYSNMWLD